MPKIRINTVLKTPTETYSYEVPAIYQEQDELITYKEPTSNNTLVKYSYKNNELIRENEQITMCYVFKQNKKTKGKVLMKELNQIVELNIVTTSLIREFNDIEVKYLVEDELYNYKIEVI